MKTRVVFEVAMGELNSRTVCLDFHVDHECMTMRDDEDEDEDEGSNDKIEAEVELEV